MRRHKSRLYGKFLALAAVCCCFPVYAQAALTIESGVYQTINLSGGNPTVDITAPVTLIGKGGDNLIITGVTSAHLRVITTRLSLGSATNAKGGLLRGNIFLDRGTLRAYGNSSMPYAYVLGGAGTSDGSIGGNGTVEVRANAIFQSGQVGTQDTPMPSVTVGNSSRFQMRNGLWADAVTVSGGSLAALSGDIHINDLKMFGEGANLDAATGDVYLNNVSSTAPANHYYGFNGIYAEHGNVDIAGNLHLEEGLTSIAAGKDITINQGNGTISGAGELYLKAGGNVNAGMARMPNTHLDALRINVGSDLAAKNARAAQISASSLDIGENLEIQGNSTDFYGNRVEYGILEVTGKNNRVGNSLRVFDAIVDVPDLTVGRDVILSAVKGGIGHLAAGGTLDFAAGQLTGETLRAKEIILGESEYSTTLEFKNLSFDSLAIGNKGLVKTDALIAPNGDIRLENGGELRLSEGDMGSETGPLGNIILGSGSSLDAPGAVYAASLTGTDVKGNSLSAQGDIQVSGAIDGNLAVQTPGLLSAKSINARSLNVTDAMVTGGILNLAEASAVSHDLTVTGAEAELRAGESAVGGRFTTLKVGGTMTLDGTELAGRNLSAGILIAGSENRTATLFVENMAPGFGLGVGKNAWVSLGDPTEQWLKTAAFSNAYANANSAPAATLGVYAPVTVGSRGLELNPAVSAPALHEGELNFAPDSLLVIYAPNARESVNEKGMISADVPMQANVQPGARLLLDGVTANNVYGVLGENITANYASSLAWDESRLETGTHLIGIRKIPGRDGWFASYTRDPETVYPGIDPGLKPPLIEGNGNPAVPAAPSTPTVTPATPAVPSNPETSTPSSPASPSEPGNAGSSSTPAAPVAPANPDTSAPSNPVAPSNPGATTPSNPVTPSNPGATTPSNPVTPSNPGANTPAAPESPTVPVEPGDPVEPVPAPDEPASSGNQAGADTQPETPVTNPAVEPALGTQDKHFHSPFAGVRFLSRVTSVKYMDHNYDLAWRTIEAAARMAVLGAVPQMTYSANLGAVEAAVNRAAFGGRAAALADELKDHSWALWITPIYRNLQGQNLTAYNACYDFSGGLGGIVLGGDYTLGDMRFGLDASMGGGYAQSGGDLATTTNNMGFAGIGAYMGWQSGNWGLAADIHFTSTWNSLSQEFPAELQMKDPKAELTARALSAGFRTEYRLPFDNWELIPHAGVRYTNLHTDNYSIYSNGAMIDGQDIVQNIWTFPFGLELRGDFNTGSGWQLKPSLDLLVTPATGDIFAKTRLYFTGVPGEGDIETQTMDYWRYGGSIGIQATKGDFSLGVNYQVQAGMHTVAQGMVGTLVYEF